MIFSLEVLQAKFGDCLILHFGDHTNHRLMVIDGGPAGVYQRSLKPRLLELKQRFSPSDPLPISLVMVSHLDDDHVNGIVALTEEVLEREKDHLSLLFQIKHFWFNTFDDIVGNLEIPRISTLPASGGAASLNHIPELAGAHHSISAVISSTSQGRKLRDLTNVLSAVVNSPFPQSPGQARLVRGDENSSGVDKDGLHIKVVHPNQKRLEEYQKKWDEDLKKAKKKAMTELLFLP